MVPRRSRHRGKGLVSLILAAALLGGALGGCGKGPDNTPEDVADAFVEAYFRQMDQKRALELTALGATRMLETELKEVEDVRKEGYEPGSVAVSVERGEPAPRDERIRIPYTIEIETEAGKQLREADIELTKLDGKWKVVRVGVRTKEPPKAD
ncbi:MAG: hypothetical protein R3B70_10900 [Polyangiaceae bacterium]